LVLSGLAVGDPDRWPGAQAALAVGDPDGGYAACAGESGEVAFDGLLGAPPQFACGVVPHDVGGVVVAVRADRLPQDDIARAVAGKADTGSAVGADAAVAARMTGVRAAGAVVTVGAGVLTDDAGVDGAEGGGGEGGEDGRVGGDVLGDALAANQAGADELVGVAAVGL